jgi:diguanylate cyclase (GGDEF)-like protein
VTPVSIQSDIVPQAVRHDFSASVRVHQDALMGRIQQSDAVLGVLREASARTDPASVAAWLVSWAAALLPAPCWAVIATNTTGQRNVLAEQGLTSQLMPSAWAVAERVTADRHEVMAADLARESTTADARGTAMGFPLLSRGRVVGVLVALDPAPSTLAPSLGDATAAWRALLEPAAIVLDHALALARVEALSVTDDLTGLANSRYLTAVLRREEKRSARSGRPLSLLFVDLDGFKNVNTNHGHQAGSQTLVEVGSVIRSCARETDVVGRYGGDEFAVVLPDTEAPGALFVARRVCERVRTSQYLLQEGIGLHITASVGIATLPDVAPSAEALLRAADRAMYHVKNNGKDGLHVAERDT